MCCESWIFTVGCILIECLRVGLGLGEITNVPLRMECGGVTDSTRHACECNVGGLSLDHFALLSVFTFSAFGSEKFIATLYL